MSVYDPPSPDPGYRGEPAISIFSASSTLNTPSSPPPPGDVAAYLAGITVQLDRQVKGAVYLKLLVKGREHLKLPYKYDCTPDTPVHWTLEPYFTLRQGAELVVQVRKRRRWPKNALLSEASLSHIELQNSLLLDGEKRHHPMRQNPSMILELVSDPTPLHTMLEVAADKAGEIRSVLDRLGKSRRFLDDLVRYGIAVGELDPVAKAVMACVGVVYHKLLEQDKCHKVIVNLAESMARTLGYIEDVEQFARINQLRKCIEEVRPLMQDTTDFIVAFINKSRMSHLFNSSVDHEKVNDLKKRFEIFQQQFDRGVAVQSGATIETLLDAISSRKDDVLLQELKPRGRESRSTIPECMRGTRLDVLSSIDDWVDDFKALNILWIRGFPGVGKSAIAGSLIQKLRAMNRLGSNFIFERAKSTTSTPNALWRSVAFDMSRLYPTVRKIVIERLEDEEVDVDSSNVKTIFRNLIEEPLLASYDIPIGRLPVVVIDALDECGGNRGQQSADREGLLSTLKRWARLPSKFKLIVTSRGEDDIERTLSPIAETLDLSSGTQVKGQASDDIHLFLKTRFAKITKGYPESLEPDWPGAEIIDELTNRAAGLFIWAKTLIGFVKEGDMALLYSRVLDNSFRLPSPSVLESFRAIAGAMVFARRPLTRSECIDILCVEPSMLDFIRRGLQSVLNKEDVLQFNHQSFVEFLLDTDKCPPPFHLLETPQHHNLTVKCLEIMKEKLHFDMCQLPTSHVRNHQINDLESRIQEYITTAVTYACRFWVDHLRAVPYEPDVFETVKGLLYEKLLYWFEVLSLINDMNSAAPLLTSVYEWCEPSQDGEFLSYLKDALKFIAAFGGVMSQSAPHIYLSALPFAPSRSRVAQRFLPQYPGTLKLQTGHLTNWPRILFVIEEHEKAVNCVAYSLDGKLIVSGSGDRTVCVWDAETGDLVSTPLAEGHASSVNSVAISADNRCVASGSDDWTVRLWDAESGDILAEPLKGHENVVASVAFSRSGRYVVSGSHDRTIRLWDLEEGGNITSSVFKGHTAGVTAVAFSGDDKYVVSGSFDRTVCVWDVETGEIVKGPFEGHTSWVNCVAFSPTDNNLVVSASDDETIQLWDLSVEEAIWDPWEAHTDSVTSVAFSSDGKRLVSGSHDETLRIWDVACGEAICGPFKGHTNGVTSVSFSFDGRRVMSGSRDETIRVWDAESRDESDEALSFTAHNDGVTSVRFTPDGRHIISGSDDETIRQWEADSGLETMKMTGHNSWIDTVAVSPDGKYVASASDDQTVCIWSLETGELARPPLEGHRHGVTSVYFFPDSRRVVSGSYDETIRIWDIETGKTILGPIEPHTSWITTVAVSSNGLLIASGSYDKTVKVMDVETGFTIVELKGHSGPVNCIAFSPDCAFLASASGDKSIRIWDMRSGELAYRPLEGHTNSVLCLSFSPDNQLLATGSVDKTIRIWDIRTGEVTLGPLEGHTAGIFSLSFSPDGTRLVSASEDETIRVWDVTSESVLSELANAGPIEFTDDSGLQSGWIAGPNSSLLFWVPPWNRSGLWWPRNTAVICNLPTRLDLSCFENGPSWRNCRDDSTR
ncbi:hypothetical protein NLJ89_g134 [Agrocybe chaxingu]|uniref:Nephrocystin 3-like N-terminal domain-containing protein n=1 Tax=Agrocybe chaxingu TaxID=84603 RepID=A0A9W8N2L0_9AGAR|nr:hypothetical protein NLJ89_g134 [Agrocybe chaxingu]